MTFGGHYRSSREHVICVARQPTEIGEASRKLSSHLLFSAFQVYCIIGIETATMPQEYDFVIIGGMSLVTTQRTSINEM